jgi:hypothetical protein
MHEARLRQARNACQGPQRKIDYAWQELYEAAILETDDGKAAKHLPVAKAAIGARLQELQMAHEVPREERQAIRDALNGLDGLRRELEKTRSHETGSSKDLNAPDQVAR